MKCLLPAGLRALRAVPCSCPQNPQEVVAVAALLAQGETEAALRGYVTYPGRVSWPCRAQQKPGGGALGSAPKLPRPSMARATEDSRVWASTSFVIRIWGLEKKLFCPDSPKLRGAMMTPLVKGVSREHPKAGAHPNLFQSQDDGGWPSSATGQISVRQEGLLKNNFSFLSK